MMKTVEANKPVPVFLKVFLSKVLTPLLFVLLFVPAAVVLRLIGRDPLDKNLDANLASYRVIRPRKVKPQDGENA